MEIVPVSALRDNYIWALCEDHACVVVDPGDAAPVERFLSATERALTAILLTHHHQDHLGGVQALVEAHGIPVFGPDSPMMPQVTRKVRDTETITLPALQLTAKVLGVPGHTREHIAWQTREALFCGDTLFGAGCGRLLGGTAQQLHTSLQKIASLPLQTRIFCAHEYTLANLRFALTVEPGNRDTHERLKRCESLRTTGVATLPSTLAEELATNPFLRTQEITVLEAVEQETGLRFETDLEVFAALRSWKDRF